MTQQTIDRDRWVLVLKVCSDCGGGMDIKIFDDKPTKEQISDFERQTQLDRCSCLSTYILELDEDNEASGEPE